MAEANEIQLKALLGINGIRLKERANGKDDRPVDPKAANEFKSVGNSTTLPSDISNQQALLKVLQQLTEKVIARLKRKKVMTTGVGITIRYKNRKTITRSKKLLNPIGQYDELFSICKELFLKNWNGEPVRLLGVTALDLVDQAHAFKQLDLFSYEKDAKKEPLINTVNQLRSKFGDKIIEKALDKRIEKNKGTNNVSETSFSKDFLDFFNKE